MVGGLDEPVEKKKKQTSGRILYRREKEQEKIVIYFFMHNSVFNTCKQIKNKKRIYSKI